MELDMTSPPSKCEKDLARFTMLDMWKEEPERRREEKREREEEEKREREIERD